MRIPLPKTEIEKLELREEILESKLRILATGEPHVMSIEVADSFISLGPPLNQTKNQFFILPCFEIMRILEDYLDEKLIYLNKQQTQTNSENDFRSFLNKPSFFRDIFPWNRETTPNITKVLDRALELKMFRYEGFKINFTKKTTQAGTGHFLRKLKRYMPEEYGISKFTSEFVYFNNKQYIYKYLTRTAPSDKIKNAVNSVFFQTNY